VTDPPRSARIVLALGIGLGLYTLVTMPTVRPEQVGLATRVYAVAAETALAGEPFYGVAPAGLSGYTFVYPPVVLLAFLPYGLLGDATLAFLLQTCLTLAAGIVLARLLLGVVERAGVELHRLDRVLVAGFVLLSVHTAPTLVNGQVNLVLGLLVAVGFLAAARDRAGLGGAALGLAATVKLFPAAFGASLLRRRDWRTLLAATATGVGLLVLGLVVFGPETTATYLTSVVPSETKTGQLAADPLAHDYLTVRRQLAVLLGDVAPDLVPVVAIAVVAPLVAITYRYAGTHEDRLLAILATVVGTLLVLPLEGLYFPLLYYPLVPLLYLLPAGRSRLLLLVGTVLTFVNATPLGVRAFLDSGLLGPALADVVEGLTLPVFRVILPATVGMWFLLAAAVYWQLRGRTDDATSVAPSPDRDAG
jgi:hypothetical protein